MILPSVRAIEAATLTAWPALQVAHDGLWLWRAARGYTKRANRAAISLYTALGFSEVYRYHYRTPA